ncbi:MAG TPA: SnoaL-like domain-containing protein [Lacunisphaera sp.]|jgi:ketosteroid isomerase-like protein|nr:SnoaL-like domain-containing protein [Lacunisphaera sp.]
MTTKEIAHRLVALCREAKWETAQRELFAENAVSREPEPNPAFPQETRGRDAIIAKGRKFDAMIEKMNAVTVSDPVVANGAFAVVMGLDAVMKGEGAVKMNEICVYVVRDGKIVSEQFFV